MHIIKGEGGGGAKPPGRTALCLCGGGITGAVYELGVLAALDDFFDGFNVSQFDVYVGTSAGALMATLMAAGLHPHTMARAVLDDTDSIMPARRSNIFQFDVREVWRISRDLLTILARTLARSARRGVVSLSELSVELEDALPPGVFTLRHFERWLEETFAKHGVPTRFADLAHELYITSNDLDSGHRAVFGEGELYDVPLPTAICASSAIPLFFEPVRVGGRDYIDGAAGKVAHMDLALKRGCELIVAVNPRVPIRNDGGELPSAVLGARRLAEKGFLAVWEQAQRMSTRTKLHASIKRYRYEYPNATIVLIEPDEHDPDMLLANPMNFAARQRVLRYGYDSAARQLLERHADLAAACARHGIATRPDKLTTRPWDLAMGRDLGS